MFLRTYFFIPLTLFFSICAVPASQAAPNFFDNNPSAEKKRFCEGLVQKFGHRSSDFNSDRYGNRVDIPVSADWYLDHTKKPWLLANRLMYVFKQTTTDGFQHVAYCTWDSNGIYDMHISRGGDSPPVLMCYFDGEQDGLGC